MTSNERRRIRYPARELRDDAGIDLVIFDCDGVLVDSEVIAVEIDRVILREHGWELSTHDIIDRFLGRSFSHVQRSLEEHLGHALPAGWEQRQSARYLEAFDPELRAVAGVEGRSTA